jgi:hypothetical protein
MNDRRSYLTPPLSLSADRQHEWRGEKGVSDPGSARVLRTYP